MEHTIKEKGILAGESGPDKIASVFNMDQTAVIIGMVGKTTIDFVINPTIDVVAK
ncbi:hypothetical protein PR001_g14804 [Phytophthora rubi]|uniref:Uncharacterized protein n=1 Tax=Phytophthora rubi TaxID=129364 RepID=A0A6A3LAY2_9STRA|nr:hypothetical protein PR001_g14804 [Phytophthora rubi]